MDLNMNAIAIIINHTYVQSLFTGETRTHRQEQGMDTLEDAMIALRTEAKRLELDGYSVTTTQKFGYLSVTAQDDLESFNIYVQFAN